MEIVISSVILLGVIGGIAAVILYLAAKKFNVVEDPRIAEIEALLPGANCGGCGLSGCGAFARACVEKGNLQGLTCTGLDADGCRRVADVIGAEAGEYVRRVAVLKCQASCDLVDPRNHYEGIRSCAIEHSLYQGESDCVYGCLGLGDCAAACPFGAMTIAEGEILPTVDIEKCTGCGMCMEGCPRSIPTIVPLQKERMVWVACGNRDRGPVALKECKVSCIGCGKCKKTCQHEAVEVKDFVALIDPSKCVGCGECEAACVRHSIKSYVVD